MVPVAGVGVPRPVRMRRCRPVHVMVVDNYNRSRRNTITAGGYDFADYDGSYKADQALIAAVEALDVSAPLYRFGDVHFVRLAEPTDDTDVIFCWRTDPDTGAFAVITDDGSSATGVGPDEWDAFRQRDAAARVRLGLPAVELPAEP